MADVGYRLKVEGEAEFSAALKEISNNIKLNKAEIALLTEEYNKNGGGIDALAKKSQELDKAVENQTDKVEAMRKMYAEAAKTIDETDPRMVRLATDIAKQETELVKLTAAQKDNEAAMKAASSGIEAYDSAVEDLDRMLAQSQAELARLDQQMRDTAESTSGVSGAAETAAEKQERLAKAAEQTAQKQQLMTQAVEAQKSKTENLQKALAAAEKTYGSSSKEADSYRLALTKAETELDKMEKELGEASAAAQKANEAMNGMGDALPQATSNAEILGGAFGDIGGKVGGILDQVGVQLPESITGVIGQFGLMAGAAGAVVSVVTGIVEEMNKARDEAAAYIDDLNTTASIADLPTDVIQEWQYMSDAVDVSVDTIIASLRKLKENMREAREAGQGFLTVGQEIVPIYDEQTGELRDLNDVFLDTLDALKSADDYLERDGIAMELFGKKASELNPLLDQSRQNIEAMRQEAHDAGYVTDEAAQRILGNWQSVQDQLKKNQEAYERNGAAYRLAIQNMDQLSASELRQIEDNLFAAEKAYANSLRATHNLFNGIKSVMMDIGRGAKEAFRGIKDFFTGGGSYASGTPSAPAGLAVVGERGTEIVRSAHASARSMRPLAAAIENATGGRYTAVGEYGPEITYMRGGERVYPHGVIPAELRRIGITAAMRGYAEGVLSASQGPAVVGERGTEIVGTGMGRAAGMTTNNYYDVRIDADRIKELDDIVRVAQSERRLRRMGYSTGR